MSEPREHFYISKLKELFADGEIDRREFLRTSTLLGLSAASAYAFVGKVTGESFVTPALAETPKDGGTLRCSMRVQEMADPAVYDWIPKSNVARQFVEYVTLTGPDNVTRPYLCESWEASDDLQTWTFKMRPGIKWSNGDDLTADHVAFNVHRWLDSATGSSVQGLLSSLTVEKDGKKEEAPGAVEVVDSHTLRLNLNKPELAIPEAFYHYPAAICHPDSLKDGKMDISARPIGTGPFSLEEFSIGDVAKLRRNKNYWGGPEGFTGGPYLEEIHYFDHGDDPSAAIAALASNQVDLLRRIAINQLDLVQQLPGVKLFEVVTAQTSVCRFQVDHEPFTDHRIRRAFQLSVDHDKLLEIAYRGKGQIAEDHHVCPIHPEYAELPKLKQNYDEAKKLLAEAGHADGITLSMDVNNDEAWEVAAAQALVDMVKPAGITLELKIQPGAQFWEIWDKTPFGQTGWTHRPLGVMVLNLAYRSGGVWNETHYSNPEFDKALDTAGSILDPRERSKVMKTCEQILQDSSVISQTLWRSVFTAGYERVKGFQEHPTEYQLFFTTWIDA
jgi:peptide/nickel transport system substrate-binding protein